MLVMNLNLSIIEPDQDDKRFNKNVDCKYGFYIHDRLSIILNFLVFTIT